MKLKEDTEFHPRLLKRLKFWYRSIALELVKHYPELMPGQVQRSVQPVLLTILIAQLLEQRQLSLFYPVLIDRLNFSSVFPPDERISASLVQSAILDVSSFFRAGQVSISILGWFYEYSLCCDLIDSQNNPKVYSQSLTHRPKGTYYTPLAIVRHIIHRTFHFRETSSSSAHLPRILDPACGSGAFLLVAYQSLLAKQETLTLIDRSQLLCDCIYGVDLDAKAIVITQLSLLCQLIENSPDVAPGNLPDLSQNIQQGNAIIAPDFVEQDPMGCSNASHTASRCLSSSHLSSSYLSSSHLSSSYLSSSHPFDWQQGFPQIWSPPSGRLGLSRQHFLGADTGFDLVIGNPPYIDSEWMTVHLPGWRQYCQTHYQTAKGNWDLFCIFIEKALELCRPGGFTSFVVPNKLASADYAASTRSLLIQQAQLLHIRDYSVVPVFSAAVYPLVYIAQKKALVNHTQATCSSDAKLVNYERMQTLETVAAQFHLDLANLQSPAQGEHSTWQTPQGRNKRESVKFGTWFFLPPDEYQLIKRLSLVFPALNAIAQVRAAATVSEAYALRPWLQDQAIPAPGDFQLINSGTIDRYCSLWGKKPCRYLGRLLRYPILPQADLVQLSAQRQRQTTQPKLILAGMSRHLEAMLDRQGAILAAKSTVILYAPPSLPPLPSLLSFLLALLNSRLLNFYFVNRFSGDRLQGGYLRVTPTQVGQLPIALPKDIPAHQNSLYGNSFYGKILALVERRLDLQPELQQKMDTNSIHSELQSSRNLQIEVNEIETAIDRLVYQLYDLTPTEIAILERSQFI